MESKANAVSRIVEIIGESTKREQPVAVSELIYHSDIAKPTYHRLVQQLDEEGFLTTDQRGNLYPGAALRNIALNLRATIPSERSCKPFCMDFRAELTKPVGLRSPMATQWSIRNGLKPTGRCALCCLLA